MFTDFFCSNCEISVRFYNFSRIFLVKWTGWIIEFFVNNVIMYFSTSILLVSRRKFVIKFLTFCMVLSLLNVSSTVSRCVTHSVLFFCKGIIQIETNRLYAVVIENVRNKIVSLKQTREFVSYKIIYEGSFKSVLSGS